MSEGETVKRMKRFTTQHRNSGFTVLYGKPFHPLHPFHRGYGLCHLFTARIFRRCCIEFRFVEHATGAKTSANLIIRVYFWCINVYSGLLRRSRESCLIAPWLPSTESK